MKTVEQELLEATGLKPRGKKESVTDFHVRISGGVSALSDDTYDTLSENAQAWFTQAADALNEDPPSPEKIAPFSEFDDTAEEEETENAGAEEEEETEKVAAIQQKKPTKVVTKPTPAAKSPASRKAAEQKEIADKLKEEAEAAKKKQKEKPPKERRSSVADTIRYAMCEQPTLSKEEVAKILKAKKLSFDPGRLDQVYSATYRVLQILTELGKIS